LGPRQARGRERAAFALVPGRKTSVVSVATVTVVPCAHNFCEACYAECAERSSRCAYCRVEVIGVQRNHGMAAMVDTFLGQHTGMQRSAEQRMEMDARAAAAEALSPVPQVSKVDESVEAAGEVALGRGTRGEQSDVVLRSSSPRGSGMTPRSTS
jgi:hypothetical protein